MTSTSRLERIRRAVSDGFLDATGGSPDAVDSSGRTDLERLAANGKLNLSDVAWLVSEVDRLRADRGHPCPRPVLTSPQS